MRQSSASRWELHVNFSSLGRGRGSLCQQPGTAPQGHERLVHKRPSPSLEQPHQSALLGEASVGRLRSLRAVCYTALMSR